MRRKRLLLPPTPTGRIRAGLAPPAPAGYLGAVVFPRIDLPGHALVDSGHGEKLERFGPVLLRRPDPQALWRPRRPPEAWAAADLTFERDAESRGQRGRWVARAGAGADARRGEWEVEVEGARLVVRPTPFKHVGLFPEQAPNWRWTAGWAAPLGRGARLLNLFGYTGAASVLAARAGFAVTHVDASRPSIAWARENAERSGLAPDALRVVVDDALAYARREVRRGARYAGVLLDPPHHGRGPRGERWQLETDLAPLVEACAALLDERAFLVLSMYAVGFSPLALSNLLEELEGGRVEADELALAEEPAPDGTPGRLLPAGYCARWTRGLEA